MHSTKHREIKQKISNELKRYLMYTFFLAILLFTFTSYERMLLEKFGNQYVPYGFCIIKALILAKVIMIGEAIKLGEKFSKKPLIIPVFYKTIMFCLLVLVLIFAEHFIVGLIEGKSFPLIYREVFIKRLNVALAQIVIMFFIFIFFFSVLGISRVLGKHKLFKLFFISASSLEE